MTGYAGFFPVLGSKPRTLLPFAKVAAFDPQCIKNHHGQNASTLARRGGASWLELWAITGGFNLPDVPRKDWPSAAEAERLVREALGE